MVSDFEQIRRFIRHTPHLENFKEKSCLKWIPLNDKEENRKIFRNVFYSTISLHLPNILRIAYNNLCTNKLYNYGQR